MTHVERLAQKLLKGDSSCAALVFSERNRRYLSGFPATDGALLVTTDGSYLLMDFRYAEAASYAVKDCQVVEFANMYEKLEELLKKHGVHRVYLETQMLSVAQAQLFTEKFRAFGVETDLSSSLDDTLMALRIIKTPEEIQKITDAQAITEAAFDHILPFIKEGVTEKELALEIEFFMRSHGAENVAFDLIVVAGKNGSLCHGVPGNTKVQKGDFITMDTGALLDGYHSDMTRTVALGNVSAEQKKVYDTVLQAQLAALDAIRPGVPCWTIDKVARDIIEKDYPGRFGHSLGHGVGVEIHEWPRFAKGSETITEPGMVVTVEPGIYLAGQFGVRIEDMIVVTENGCENLTSSKKDLIIL